MIVGWILLGVLVWAIGIFLVLVLLRMSGDEDRAARHLEKRLNPESEVTITRAGDG